MSTDASDTALDVSRYAWPELELDPIRRMRAIAAGLPHVAAREALFDVPVDRFWSFLTDFETNTAKIEGAVGEVRVLERQRDPVSADDPLEAGRAEAQTERIVLDVRTPLLGSWTKFDVVVRPGWCLMQSRLGQIGMAASAAGSDKTRYFHFEGSTLLGRIGRPFFGWNIRQDFRKLRLLLD